MIPELIKPEDLQLIFKELLKQKNTIFVFATDVAMNSWIDWIVCNPDISGTTAVALENFIAWDIFKSKYTNAQITQKNAIPTLLRKLFVQNLIFQNEQQPFLKSLIHPKYIDTASSFATWLDTILTNLEFWHKKVLENQESYINDDEDSDLLELYNRYNQFLQDNNLYEPNWFSPDFSDTNNNFVLIYPEILDDYSEYKELLENSPNVKIISLPKNSAPAPLCYKYSDSRKELRRTLLQIRNLVQEKKASWNEISLNVPDLQTYRPYLERELTNYCIPYIMRSGLPLTIGCAGSIFLEIENCYKSNFSYESVRTLLLNEYIPWKSNLKTVRENLIKEGCKLHCVCSFQDDNESQKFVDVWEQSLSINPQNSREINLYSTLKEDISRIYDASSFSGILTAWFIFKNNFLEETNFTVFSNNIISRCIVTLQELVEIENVFCEPINLITHNPYDFFLSELKEKTYIPQTSSTGISIFPYRLSAQANIKFQFIIDASQKNLEIQNKRLDFLNNQKRKNLGLLNYDKIYNPSKLLIQLYAKNQNSNIIQFSYSEESFSGFAIAHNYLTVVQQQEPLQELDVKDFYINELNYFLNSTKIPFDFTEFQKQQFLTWQQKKHIPDQEQAISTELTNKISFVLKENRKKHISDPDSKIVITQDDMKDFFPCQRKWLFAHVLMLNEDTLATNLLSPYDLGDINHKVLEKFVEYCKTNLNGKLPITTEDNCFENEQELEKIVHEIVKNTIHKDTSMNFYESFLSKTVLDSQETFIANNIMDFLHNMCLIKNFGGFNIYSTEQWYSNTKTDISWYYSGKIDCILINNNESVYILDYKTSKPPIIRDCKIAEDGSLKNFQIPMYISLWNNEHPNIQVDNALFYSINKKQSSFIVQPTQNKPANSKSVDIQEYQHTLQVFDLYCQKFSNLIETNNFEPQKNKNDIFNYVETYKDCSSCKFNNICRTTFNIK